MKIFRKLRAVISLTGHRKTRFEKVIRQTWFKLIHSLLQGEKGFTNVCSHNRSFMTKVFPEIKKKTWSKKNLHVWEIRDCASKLNIWPKLNQGNKHTCALTKFYVHRKEEMELLLWERIIFKWLDNVDHPLCNVMDGFRKRKKYIKICTKFRLRENDKGQ